MKLFARHQTNPASNAEGAAKSRGRRSLAAKRSEEPKPKLKGASKQMEVDV